MTAVWIKSPSGQLTAFLFFDDVVFDLKLLLSVNQCRPLVILRLLGPGIEMAGTSPAMTI
ncbi:MAG TPA: hypothetical protein VGQ97_02410 [Xanthobacteraceae bacterium]|nr:hypothetical protein [Xanthobacteraceae bacterium]